MIEDGYSSGVTSITAASIENPLNRKKIMFSVDNGESKVVGLHGGEMEEVESKPEKEKLTLWSYYFMLVWAGVPFPSLSKNQQTIYDIFFGFLIVGLGTIYCFFLIGTTGFLDSVMWLFIEFGAMGCWCSYFYAIRWNDVYKPYTRSVDVWRTDVAFVLIGIGLYAVLAGVYYSEFNSMLSGLRFSAKVIEIIHGATSWARFGAIAATAQSFFTAASSNYLALRNLREVMESEIETAFLFRKSAYLVQYRSRSDTETTNTLFPADSVYAARDDLIYKWLTLNQRTQHCNRIYSSYLAVLITSQSIAFLTWSLNNLISTDTTVNRNIAGVTILGYSVTAILIVAKASQLTSEMEKSAGTASEYWSCTTKAELRNLYPGLADSIKVRIIQRDYATKIFDFSISRYFLFEFLAAIASLTIAVLRLKATWH